LKDFNNLLFNENITKYSIGLPFENIDYLWAKFKEFICKNYARLNNYIFTGKSPQYDLSNLQCRQ